MTRVITMCFLIWVALFAFRARVLAQGETTSAINGEVTDTSSATVPGAKITITKLETGLQRSAITDAEGRFNFPQLQPGTYSVRVEADGFDPQQLDKVVAGLGQTQAANFTLSVARTKLEKYLVVAGRAEMWLRMYGVP